MKQLVDRLVYTRSVGECETCNLIGREGGRGGERRGLLAHTLQLGCTVYVRKLRMCLFDNWEIILHVHHLLLTA